MLTPTPQPSPAPASGQVIDRLGAGDAVVRRIRWLIALRARRGAKARFVSIRGGAA